jgi:hypothetical protein
VKRPGRPKRPTAAAGLTSQGIDKNLAKRFDVQEGLASDLQRWQLANKIAPA